MHIAVVFTFLSRALSNVVANVICAKHVSARGLVDMKAPTSLQRMLKESYQRW